jgi:hypothetical protein
MSDSVLAHVSGSSGSDRPVSRTAVEYSNVINRERLRETSIGR